MHAIVTLNHLNGQTEAILVKVRQRYLRAKSLGNFISRKSKIFRIKVIAFTSHSKKVRRF